VTIKKHLNKNKKRPPSRPSMTRIRRDFFDIPRKVQLNEEQSDWADHRCDQKKIPFTAYIRLLIDEDKKRVEKELLQKQQASNRPNLGPTLASPNGLSQQQLEAAVTIAVAAILQLNKR
jgi:hypothetical protein